MKKSLLSLLLVLFTLSSFSQNKKKQWDPFLDTLQRRTIQWFLDVTPESTGLTPDRWPAEWSPSSIAAVGFALTTYPIAAEGKLMTRAQAAQRTLTTLRFLWKLPQGEARADIAGYKGFFYHFIKKDNGLREWNCELSTIDTGLLMAGVLFSQSYFTQNTRVESEIRRLADVLYRRVDWRWAMSDTTGILLGWDPDKGFHHMTWQGYNEAMILYILALGSPTHSVSSSAWRHWTATYKWAEYYGQEFISFGPLFGHQYSHCWIDFRGIQDTYMREKNLDYFENSRRATYSQQSYAKDNPAKWRDFSDTIWGITASDGPQATSFVVDGIQRKFETYAGRGVSVDWVNDDGTIAPTAVGGSVAFAPEICISALKSMRVKYDSSLWTKYGFVDAFNPTYITPSTPQGWFDKDYLGIDQGPIVLMIENHRNGFVWNVMKKNKYIVAGLKKAGFTGGWLSSKP
jgi:hypothetical protein